MTPIASLENDVKSASEFVASRLKKTPRYGIILGTGSGVLADQIQTELELDYGSIPGFPVSTALGHKGCFIAGSLADQPIVAMNGRFHLYEGHDIDRATLPIRVMRSLGIQTLFVTNASGGINPKFRSGEIMAIRSHIDFMNRPTFGSSVEIVLERPAHRSDRYDQGLIELAQQCARAHDFELQTGTYAALLGPNYETRAEYRMLRRIGADVAGMSTVPEVCIANLLDIKVLGLSVVTNVAKPDVLEQTSGQEVIDAAQMAAPQVYKIVEAIIRQHNELASS